MEARTTGRTARLVHSPSKRGLVRFILLRSVALYASIVSSPSLHHAACRHQIPKRHRGNQNAGSPRRLIDLVTQSPA